MIDLPAQKQLQQIWDNYKAHGNQVLDTKGREYENIDESRLVAIKDIKVMIQSFLDGKLELPEFKTNLDSYNKQHNYWGFTAAKGQMFFNLLTRSSEGNTTKYIALLKEVLKEPDSLQDALSKMKQVFEYAILFQQQASDKRFVANPLSAAYFLSYFWQIHNHDQWPIMYSSIIVSFERLGIWQPLATAYDNYNKFYLLNEEARQIIAVHAKQPISNWDVEHALWHFAGTVAVNSKQQKSKKEREVKAATPVSDEPLVVEAPVQEAGFDLSEYLIPKVAKLVELGTKTETSTTNRAREFELTVGEAFNQLDFDVELLGQGMGREPDALIKYPSDHVAFLVDAKAYSNGYTLGTDDRAIREYINRHCPRLKQAGFNKLGFIIVSNSFKSDLKDVINEITWTTDIKRFLLLTTEALLYLVAYKAKGKIPITQIIEKLISFETIVTKEMIIESFGDY